MENSISIKHLCFGHCLKTAKSNNFVTFIAAFYTWTWSFWYTYIWIIFGRKKMENYIFQVFKTSLWKHSLSAVVRKTLNQPFCYLYCLYRFHTWTRPFLYSKASQQIALCLLYRPEPTSCMKLNLMVPISILLRILSVRYIRVEYIPDC